MTPLATLASTTPNSPAALTHRDQVPARRFEIRLGALTVNLTWSEPTEADLNALTADEVRQCAVEALLLGSLTETAD